MIIVDTGFWLALANKKDRHHARAVEVFAGIHEPLMTTWPVMTETCHLLLQRRGTQAQRRFLPKICSFERHNPFLA
jgi:predicted nucleic acid-binding protein